jgi:hypothetical protein
MRLTCGALLKQFLPNGMAATTMRSISWLIRSMGGAAKFAILSEPSATPAAIHFPTGKSPSP